MGQDMARCVENAMRGNDAAVHVELIAGTYNWQSYLKVMPFNIHGIAIVESEEAVNHCWRLIHRSELQHYQVNGSTFDWVIQTVF